MKKTGLLNNADLREFASRGLPDITLGTDVGRIGRMDGGIRLSLSGDATPSPFEVIMVEASSQRWTRVYIQPSVIIGCQGFVVPRYSDVPIIGTPRPIITNPGDYLFIKMHFEPVVISSDVTQGDMDTSVGNTNYPESCSIHYIAGARITGCDIVSGETISEFDDVQWSGEGWNQADGDKTGDYYAAFAQWNVEAFRYENLFDGKTPIFNCRPSGDLINLGFAADQNTSATMLFG